MSSPISGDASDSGPSSTSLTTTRIKPSLVRSEAHSPSHVYFASSVDRPNGHNVLPQRLEIKPSDCREELGYAWSLSKKNLIIFVTFLVQISMNLNTTLCSNALRGIEQTYGVSRSQSLWGGAASFLITYAFGCELWAPWSEEFGRRWVLQSSLGLVNIFGILAAFGPNFPSHVIARVLGGLSTAGGSVTLAVVNDLWKPDEIKMQYGCLTIVFSSVSGSIVGPIIGGFLETFLGWQWCIFVQIIFGAFVQVLHYFLVPETRSTVIMDRVAQKRRRDGTNSYLYGPGEMSDKRIDWNDTLAVWLRPFRMLFKDPIVLVLSLLSGSSDGLIFMMVQSFKVVYDQWDFNQIEHGLIFLSIGLGYVVAAFSFIPAIRRNFHERAQHPEDERAQYEARLWWLLFLATLLPIGLFLFAFVADHAGPGGAVHWMFSAVAICLIGIANFGIYQASIDYVLRAYGPYAASATGGNGWARDVLAGVLTPYGEAMYRNLGIFAATMMLFAISVVLVAAVYVVYLYGPRLRRASPWAQTLRAQEEESAGGDGGGGDHVVAYAGPDKMPWSRSGNATPTASRAASRRPTPVQSPVSSRRNSMTVAAVDSLDLSPVQENIELADLAPASDADGATKSGLGRKLA
ncbi:major facilitator superfamily domain-containing protein [Xylariaceae sp. FL0016]|nr:major facilitator superfamily domain-containing protein [Xylariaceae sp. FL0016]